jgi:hypothetical protein
MITTDDIFFVGSWALSKSGFMCRCGCSHAISMRKAPALSASQKPAVGAGGRPEALVRTDRHAQKLYKFFLPSSKPAASNSSPAVPQQVAEPQGDIVEAEPPGSADGQDQQELPEESLLPTAKPIASVAKQGQQELPLTAQREGKRPRLDTATASILAAAREKVQMETHAGGLLTACSLSWQMIC